MAILNANLRSAKKAKNDEFYTQLTDIEKELKHYKDFFKGKVVYCNCDDARESNFFKYFSLNFEHLGLKQLITTAFKADGHGVKLVYNGDTNGNHIVDEEEIEITELEGNGDFRSTECLDILEHCDVVVTNPPFSLFREYIATLVRYNKKFLVIGAKNAISYKDVFPLIKDNKLWIGAKTMSGSMWYECPNGYTDKNSKEINGKWLTPIATCWYTNIEHSKRNTPLDLYKRYTAEDYPKYDNYDAIECSKTTDIPMDYEGVIGVPITFLDKYCPSQFQIVGLMSGAKGEGLTNGNDGRAKFYVNNKGVYTRILIKFV